MQGLTEKNTTRWFCAAGLRVRVEIFLHPKGYKWQAKRTLAAPEPTNRNFALACVWLMPAIIAFLYELVRVPKFYPALLIQ